MGDKAIVTNLGFYSVEVDPTIPDDPHYAPVPKPKKEKLDEDEY